MSTVRAWRFGNAAARYDQSDEDKFRASVAQALQVVAGSFTVTGGSGALEVDSSGAIVAAGVNALNLSNEFVATVTQTTPTVVVGVSLANVQPNAHTWSAAQTFSVGVTLTAGPLIVGADPGGANIVRIGGAVAITSGAVSSSTSLILGTTRQYAAMRPTTPRSCLRLASPAARRGYTRRIQTARRAFGYSATAA